MKDSTDQSTEMVDSDSSDDSMHSLTSNNVDEFASCESDDSDTTTRNSKLLYYTDLLRDLTKKKPNSDYGDFESLANASFCKECQTVLQPNLINRILCKVPELIVKQDGTVVSVHAKCDRLNVTNYIRRIVKEYGSWRKTYWRVWSECHFLTCVACELKYPVRNSAMCQYHPETPEYYPLGDLGLEQPIGRYPCCGEGTFRFEPIRNPYGCQFRMHEPKLKNDRDKLIKKMMQKHHKYTIAKPPSSNFETKVMKFASSDPDIKISNYQPWWKKMTLGDTHLVHRPIINSAWSTTDDERKQKKSKYLNKISKKKRNINDRVELFDSILTQLNCTENTDIDKNYFYMPPLYDESECSRECMKQNFVIPFQDLQREQEIVFFSKIKARCIKPRKGVNHLSDKTINSYTAIHAKIVGKVKSNGRAMVTKSRKSSTANKKK